MRISHLALLATLCAGSVAAQGRRPPILRPPELVLQSVTVDVASAFQQHWRAMIEPLVFGRFTLGLSGEYTTQPDEGPYGYAYPVDSCAYNSLCARDVAQFSDGNGSGYRAWSFNVHARWYPRALSYSGQRQSVAAYFGEFVGFHERRSSQQIYYGYPPCPSCETDAPPPPDSAITNTTPVPCCGGGSSFYTQVVHGWEPGAEFGVRVLPMRHVVMDIGGRFRLARIEDYQSGTRPGGVDARLVVAIGASW